MNGNVVKLGTNGRLVIPAKVRKALGLSPGDSLLMTVRNGELLIRTPAEAVTRAQQIVQRHLPQGHSLSEELLRQRRDEAERDE